MDGWMDGWMNHDSDRRRHEELIMHLWENGIAMVLAAIINVSRPRRVWSGITWVITLLST